MDNINRLMADALETYKSGKLKPCSQVFVSCDGTRGCMLTAAYFHHHNQVQKESSDMCEWVARHYGLEAKEIAVIIQAFDSRPRISGFDQQIYNLIRNFSLKIMAYME